MNNNIDNDRMVKKIKQRKNIYYDEVIIYFSGNICHDNFASFRPLQYLKNCPRAKITCYNKSFV